MIGARPEHMENLLARFADMGLEFTIGAASLRVAADGRLRSIDVPTLPYPGIATDYKPLMITMLGVADGVGIVTENLYPGRFRYVEELIRLGADIRTDGHHAVVRGVPRLSGAPVRAHDIRAGAAMVVAGLAAEGETTISGVAHIDRGYDDLVGRLRRRRRRHRTGLTDRRRSVGVRRRARALPGTGSAPGPCSAAGGAARLSRFFGQPQEAADERDRRRHQQHLVPPALVGEQAGRRITSPTQRRPTRNLRRVDLVDWCIETPATPNPPRCQEQECCARRSRRRSR